MKEVISLIYDTNKKVNPQNDDIIYKYLKLFTIELLLKLAIEINLL